MSAAPGVLILKEQVYKSRDSMKSSDQHSRNVMGGGPEKRQCAFDRGKAVYRF